MILGRTGRVGHGGTRVRRRDPRTSSEVGEMGRGQKGGETSDLPEHVCLEVRGDHSLINESDSQVVHE